MLGASHALLPGHGKTVMAAYIAGRQGTVRDAVIVGATVTGTHTGGVLLLGLALTVSTSLAGEDVLAWLGVSSGTLVAILGASLLIAAIRHRGRSPFGHGHTHRYTLGGHSHGPGGHHHHHGDGGHHHHHGDGDHHHHHGDGDHDHGGHHHHAPEPPPVRVLELVGAGASRESLVRSAQISLGGTVLTGRCAAAGPDDHHLRARTQTSNRSRSGSPASA